MKTIPLKNSDRMITVDDKDYHFVSKRKWRLSCQPWGCYVIEVGLHGKLLSRYISRLKPSDVRRVVYKDGDSLNNRRGNLMLATRTEVNQRRKRPANNTSGYKGVYFVPTSGLWRVTISRGGKNLYTGPRFADKVQAARAYDEKAKELFGDFAVLNFPRPHRTRS